MSKYIIELNEECTRGFIVFGTDGDGKVICTTRYIDTLEQLDSDYINEHFSDLQDDAYNKGYAQCQDDYSDALKHAKDVAYQRGLNDAWECARKLFSSMADSDIEKAFPIEWNNGGFNALINLQPQEAIEKLKAYEEKQKADEDVKRGDVVRHKINGLTYIVTLASDCGYVLLGDDGNFATRCITNIFEKTGKHFDIDKILEDMRRD